MARSRGRSGAESAHRVSFIWCATGHRLRPIREADVEIDYPAVMGSRDRLWAKYGTAWGWPPATMSYEADKEDLARREAEIAAQETFNSSCSTKGKRSCSA